LSRYARGIAENDADLQAVSAKVFATAEFGKAMKAATALTHRLLASGRNSGSLDDAGQWHRFVAAIDSDRPAWRREASRCSCQVEIRAIR
jgi:hypothetical protein